MGALKRGLDGLCSLAANEVLKLPGKLAVHGLLSEDEIGHRDRNHEQRRGSEDRIISERGGQARSVIARPVANGFLDEKAGGPVNLHAS